MSSFLTDTFTDTAGTLLQSHAPNTGGTWTRHPSYASSSAAISNANRLRGNFNGNSVYYNSQDPGTADYTVEADFVVLDATAMTVGIGARIDTAADTRAMLFYNHGSGVWTLSRFVTGGTYNATTNFTHALGVGVHHVELVVRGVYLMVIVDGVLLLTVLDNNVMGRGRAGLYFDTLQANTTGVHIDNFVGAVPLAVPVTDSNLFFSPANWYSDGGGALQANNICAGSTYALSSNPGAYFKFNITPVANGYCNLIVDCNALNGLTAGDTPRIAVSVDYGPLTITQLSYNSFNAGIQVIPISVEGQSLTNTSHVVQVWFHHLNPQNSGEVWSSVSSLASVVKVTGVELDGIGSATAAPTLRPNTMIVFGDSITEGAMALNAAFDVTSQDATVSYANLLAQGMNAEVGVIGYYGQGFETAGRGNIPALPTAYNSYWSGHARKWPSTIHYIINNHGTNGTVTALDVSTMIANFRAVSATAFIAQCQTFGQANYSSIATGVANYLAAHPTETSVAVLDPLENFCNNTSLGTHALMNSFDGLHPNYTYGHPRYGAALLSKLRVAADQASYLGTVYTRVTAALTAAGDLTGKVLGNSPTSIVGVGVTVDGTTIGQNVLGLPLTDPVLAVPTDPPTFGGALISLLEVQPLTNFKYRLTANSLTNAPSGGLLGTSSVTLTFHDSLGAPVPNVEFTIPGQGSMRADSSGVAAFSLNDGGYTVLAAPTNLIIFPTTALTVSGTTALTITGAAANIPLPPTPAQTTAYGVTRDAHGNPVGAVPITFQMINPEQGVDIYNGAEFTATSDSSGNLAVILLKLAKYRVRTANGKFDQFETSADDTQPLPNVLGGY